MGCASSRPEDDELLRQLARHSCGKRTWFGHLATPPASPVPRLHLSWKHDSVAAKEEGADTVRVQEEEPSSSEREQVLDEDERSLLRVRTLLELRILLDATGGRFTVDTIPEAELRRFMHVVHALGHKMSGMPARGAIEAWYRFEAGRTAAVASSIVKPASTSEVGIDDFAASAASAQPPSPSSKPSPPVVDADPPPPPPHDAALPSTSLSSQPHAQLPAQSPVPRAIAVAPPKTIEAVAHETMATLRELVTATGGEFTPATVPPRLLGRLSSDVARIREELENRRADRLASNSTASKRLAIEKWYHEQLAAERREQAELREYCASLGAHALLANDVGVRGARRRRAESPYVFDQPRRPRGSVPSFLLDC